MAKLNEYNEKTKGNIHLMVTTLCDRDCKYCCNKQYDLNDIPQVTDEELKNCHTVYITGGEPFLFSNPVAIAIFLKSRYPNIKTIRVYTNARAVADYIGWYDGQYINKFESIDGLSVSIKNKEDWESFPIIVGDADVQRMESNYLYLFNGFKCPTPEDSLLMAMYRDGMKNFKVIERWWQVNFVPDATSIFRRI
jgi:hypothetical protein